MAHCYILYSKSLDKYYVGACYNDLEQRIENHNSVKYAKSYTSQASDWQLYLSFKGEEYTHVRRMEMKIKSMKSHKYIENVKRYDDLQQKLIHNTST